jgi:phage terminase large subunit GpA-like protein
MTEDGRQIAIRATAIDSGGHFTNTVYQYAIRTGRKRVFAIKGVGGEGKAHSWQAIQE